MARGVVVLAEGRRALRAAVRNPAKSMALNCGSVLCTTVVKTLSASDVYTAWSIDGDCNGHVVALRSLNRGSSSECLVAGVKADTLRGTVFID